MSNVNIKDFPISTFKLIQTVLKEKGVYPANFHSRFYEDGIILNIHRLTGVSKIMLYIEDGDLDGDIEHVSVDNSLNFEHWFGKSLTDLDINGTIKLSEVSDWLSSVRDEVSNAIKTTLKSHDISKEFNIENELLAVSFLFNRYIDTFIVLEQADFELPVDTDIYSRLIPTRLYTTAEVMIMLDTVHGIELDGFTHNFNKGRYKHNKSGIIISLLSKLEFAEKDKRKHKLTIYTNGDKFEYTVYTESLIFSKPLYSTSSMDALSASCAVRIIAIDLIKKLNTAISKEYLDITAALIEQYVTHWDTKLTFGVAPEAALIVDKVKGETNE